MHTGENQIQFNNGPNGIITILWACYGSDYGNLPWGDPTGCLGQRYAMEANGLASVGVAKSGYTFGMEQTIEGLANGAELHPLQKAFLDHGAFQCGFCAPGMLMSSKALLDENSSPDKQQIKEGIDGNICRCTGYNSIIRAVTDVVKGKYKEEK